MEAVGEEGGICEGDLLPGQEEEARRVPRAGGAMAEAQGTRMTTQPSSSSLL